MSLRVVVVGGSGLIGASVAAELRERGHAVTAVARTRRPGVDHVLDVKTAPADRLRELLAGHNGVVFAARTDEQKPLRRPVHAALRRAMVEPVARLFTAARLAGLSRGVIMGSYYTYLDRSHPRWRLTARHAYIRCRAEQAREARAAAGPGLPVAVLELPFVFGRVGDRLPNWAPPLTRWAGSAVPLLAPPGGTAVTSAAGVARAAADALDRADGSDLPVADENLTWHEMLTRIAVAAGRPRAVHRLPAAALRAATRLGGVAQAVGRRETGLNTYRLGDLLLADLFVEPVSGRSIDQAIRETCWEA